MQTTRNKTTAVLALKFSNWKKNTSMIRFRDIVGECCGTMMEARIRYLSEKAAK